MINIFIDPKWSESAASDPANIARRYDSFRVIWIWNLEDINLNSDFFSFDLNTTYSDLWRRKSYHKVIIHITIHFYLCMSLISDLLCSAVLFRLTSQADQHKEGCERKGKVNEAIADQVRRINWISRIKYGGQHLWLMDVHSKVLHNI